MAGFAQMVLKSGFGKRLKKKAEKKLASGELSADSGIVDFLGLDGGSTPPETASDMPAEEDDQKPRRLPGFAGAVGSMLSSKLKSKATRRGGLAASLVNSL